MCERHSVKKALSAVKARFSVLLNTLIRNQLYADRLPLLGAAPLWCHRIVLDEGVVINSYRCNSGAAALHSIFTDQVYYWVSGCCTRLAAAAALLRAQYALTWEGV